jgi:hypothetical protein
VELDKAVTLLQNAAVGSGYAETLASDLKSFQPSVPEMPPTSALLHEIPVSGKHPGAQYRLAGDRLAAPISQRCYSFARVLPEFCQDQGHEP